MYSIIKDCFAGFGLTWEREKSPPLPTDKRVAGMAANPDPSLLALYFNLGRYLLITSSRPGSQPANLRASGTQNYVHLGVPTGLPTLTCR